MERQYKTSILSLYQDYHNYTSRDGWIVEGDNNVKESFEVIQQIRRLLTVRT
jgi:hypothetical protein